MIQQATTLIQKNSTMDSLSPGCFICTIFVLTQETLLSQCFSPPKCINGMGGEGEGGAGGTGKFNAGR